MKKLLLIDLYNLLFRAYHAMPITFKDAEGSPTNAVYGVTSMLINLLDQIKPEYAIAAVDSPKSTFRVEQFTAYKAHRKPMDEALEVQIPKVLEILDAFGISRFMLDGYEADDIIGTFAKKFAGDVDVIVVSNDRDMWQLLTDHVIMLVPNTKGDVEWVGHKEAVARWQIEPNIIPDYKGLRGDPSDNIPGVHGVGEITAVKLLKQFGTLENIYKNIDQVTPAGLKEKLLNNYEEALLSKKLATIIVDAPLRTTLDECKVSLFDRVRVKTVLERYNFKSLIRRLGFEVTIPNKKKTGMENMQGLPGLF